MLNRNRASSLLALTALMLSVGCLGSSSYKIVAMKRYTENQNGEDREMISFVIRHGGVTIKAHCQAWDIHNTCKLLEVSQSYKFKRDMDYLSLDNFNGGSAMLGVEEESIDK